MRRDSISMKDVEELLGKVMEDSVTNANEVANLIGCIDAEATFESAAVAVRAIEGLNHFFCSTSGHEGAKMIDSPSFASFKRGAAKSFRRACLAVLRKGEESSMQVAAAVSLMNLARGAGDAVSGDIVKEVIDAVVHSRCLSDEVMGLLASKYLKHWDVRFWALQCVSRAAAAICDDPGAPGSDGGASQGTAKDDVACTMFDVLRSLPASLGDEPVAWTRGGVPLEAGNDVSGSGRKRRRGGHESAPRPKWTDRTEQVQQYSGAWLAFLRMALPQDLIRRVLISIHAVVIPNMVNPLLLSDFLTKSLDRGGIVGILALHGIFILVSKHGLEYPGFYRRLYTLLQAAVFHIKQRAHFFKLVDLFLSSPLVPAYTMAAFAKRFARLALVAPPHGASLCLGFIHNILRRHPACHALLHRPGAPESAGCDPYLPEEEDPSKARASESCLWEVASLAVHCSSSVSTAAAAVLRTDYSNAQKTAERDVEALLQASYSESFKHERKVSARRRAVVRAGPLGQKHIGSGEHWAFMDLSSE